jgi:hypothetical protein
MITNALLVFDFVCLNWFLLRLFSFVDALQHPGGSADFSGRAVWDRYR